MIVQEALDYKADHFVPILCEKIDTALQAAFGLSELLRNNDRMKAEINAVVAEAVKDMIRERHADRPSDGPAVAYTSLDPSPTKKRSAFLRTRLL